MILDFSPIKRYIRFCILFFVFFVLILECVPKGFYFGDSASRALLYGLCSKGAFVRICFEDSALEMFLELYFRGVLQGMLREVLQRGAVTPHRVEPIYDDVLSLHEFPCHFCLESEETFGINNALEAFQLSSPDLLLAEG